MPGLSAAAFGDIRPETVDFRPFPAFPEGALLAILVGDPTQPGPFVIRVKVPGGVKLMPHVHSESRIYTIISGVFYVGRGTTFDPAQLKAYAPGSVIVLPSGTAHFHWAQSGEYIAQVNAVGPLGLEYLDPHDDPRKR
jgi:quercetin dioxygenase-like cupin family protein